MSPISFSIIILRKLNNSSINIVSKILAFFVCLLPNKANLIAKLQLKKMLGIEKNFWIRYKMFNHFIYVAFDNLNLKKNYAEKKYNFVIKNEELLAEIKNKNDSAFIFPSHTGNWELLAKFVTDNYFTLVATARKARKPSVQKLIEKQRADSGIKVVWRTDDANRTSVRALLNHIKGNSVITALIDQDTRVESVISNFFGYKAKTPSTLCRFAKKFDKDIYFCFNAKINKNTYKIEFYKANKYDSIEEIIQDYNDKLEVFIRKHPEQWVWFHKRWRLSDTEFHKSSKEYIKFLKN